MSDISMLKVEGTMWRAKKNNGELMDFVRNGKKICVL